MKKMKSPKQQRGLTLTGLIMGCVVLAVAALGFMKLWPVYNEKFKVDQAMDKLQLNPEGYRLNKLEMARAIMRQFDVNDVDDFDMPRLMKVLKVGRKKGSPNKVAMMIYEIRAPFFSNLDIVMNYRKVVEFAPPKTD